MDGEGLGVMGQVVTKTYLQDRYGPGAGHRAMESPKDGAGGLGSVCGFLYLGLQVKQSALT